MKTYQYHSVIFDSDVQVSYNRNGILQGFTVMNQPNKVQSQLAEFKNWFKEVDFLFAAKTHKLKLTEVERDVTFELFWEAYKEKNCGRTKAEAAWNKLTKAEMIEAFDFIGAFNGILKMNGTAKPYATSYLNQKRWVR
jgi:hypothetical protein